LVAEYLEETPLGKAEWIKFIGALFEKNEQASEYFNHIEQEYKRLKIRVEEKTNHPAVLVGSPYKDAWWVPGGNSYLANLIADAGGNYLGKNHKSHESYVISFENALAWGSKADIWINMGNYSTRQEIIAADQRFGRIKVFNEGKIYNNIKKLGSHGGNDFWESGTINPHLVLHDLISIFHPDLAEADLIYYEKIR
jgi:iron complex transport system substrate-binding protein